MSSSQHHTKYFERIHINAYLLPSSEEHTIDKNWKEKKDIKNKGCGQITSWNKLSDNYIQR